MHFPSEYRAIVLARTLGVTQQAISKHLNDAVMVQKQGIWVPYELKPRDVERRLFACEQLLERQRRKVFLHRIDWGRKMGLLRQSQAQRIIGISWSYFHVDGQTKVMLCIWWDQLGVVHYELLKTDQTITGDLYRTQLMSLS